MRQSLGLVTLLVHSYDSALAFFLHKLHFDLIENTYIPSQDKRWVVVSPPSSASPSCRLLLAQATTPDQVRCVGKQAGGQVFLFLHTDDFQRDFEGMRRAGVGVVRVLKVESYGTTAVFEDCEGNLWDLLEPSNQNRSAS